LLAKRSSTTNYLSQQLGALADQLYFFLLTNRTFYHNLWA